MVSKIKDKFVSPLSFGILVKKIFPGKFPYFQNLLPNNFFIVTSVFKPTLKLITSIIEKRIFWLNPLQPSAWLYGIDFLEWYTWQDENSKYCWVCVGLIHKSVRSLFQLRITSTSKKWTLSKEYSTVNFIVGW